uniref:Uncharacterized protein n=1 Tax=Oryza nivara TaxID=4536 RepID=A0A0E0I6Y7_ORYNI
MPLTRTASGKGEDGGQEGTDAGELGRGLNLKLLSFSALSPSSRFSDEDSGGRARRRTARPLLSLSGRTAVTSTVGRLRAWRGSGSCGGGVLGAEWRRLSPPPSAGADSPNPEAEEAGEGGSGAERCRGRGGREAPGRGRRARRHGRRRGGASHRWGRRPQTPAPPSPYPAPQQRALGGVFLAEVAARPRLPRGRRAAARSSSTGATRPCLPLKAGWSGGPSGDGDDAGLSGQIRPRPTGSRRRRRGRTRHRPRAPLLLRAFPIEPASFSDEDGGGGTDRSGAATSSPATSRSATRSGRRQRGRRWRGREGTTSWRHALHSASSRRSLCLARARNRVSLLGSERLNKDVVLRDTSAKFLASTTRQRST